MGELEACPSRRGDWAGRPWGAGLARRLGAGPGTRADWTRGGGGAQSGEASGSPWGGVAAVPARPGGRGPGSARGHRCAGSRTLPAGRPAPETLPPRQVRPSGGGEASKAGSHAVGPRADEGSGGQFHWQWFFDPRRPLCALAAALPCARRPPTAPWPRPPVSSLFPPGPPRPAPALPTIRSRDGFSAERRSSPCLLSDLSWWPRPPRPPSAYGDAFCRALPTVPPLLLVGPAVGPCPPASLARSLQVPADPPEPALCSGVASGGPFLRVWGSVVPVGGPPELASLSQSSSPLVKSALRSQAT